VLGYSWQSALGAIFFGGILFTIISALRIRTWLANSIPDSLKISFAVGIGLFLALIGLNDTGIVKLGTEGAPVHVGDLQSGTAILAVIGFLLISVFMIRKIKGAILLGIIIVTALAFIFKVSDLPEEVMSMPPSLEPIFLQLDIRTAFQWGFFSVILTVFVMDFVDTTGTLLGLSYKSGLLDENGNLPEIEKPMLCDSVSTVVASLLGTTTTGAFIESATGIESGGRSGFTSVVTAILFLAALFFTPLLTAVPTCAYGPALIVVGLLMMTPVTAIRFDDLTEAIPAFCVIILMSFTYNIGIGMTAGFATYVVIKLCTGRVREISVGMWILGIMSALFFVFYPY
jgi:AGZA family xanthine/uracil permease-like MFS transporter